MDVRIQIGLATREDVAAILAISNWAAEHTPANFATEPEALESWTTLYDDTAVRYPWLVARDESGVVGYAKASPHKSRGAYAWTVELAVYIRADQHRRGIGKALYRRLIPMLRRQGFVTALAGITDGNAASVALHMAFGFVPCATFHRVGWKFGGWHDVRYFELDLRPGDHMPVQTKPVAEVWPSELRTERLWLRRWRDSDLAPFAALNADPAVMEHFPAPLSATESDALAGRIRSFLDGRGFGNWAVEIPGVTAFAGFVGLSVPRFQAPFTPCVEVGWRLAPAHWGQGYATEGARAAMEFGFTELGLDEIVSFTAPGNLASRRVMEKVGMQYAEELVFEHPSVPVGHRLRPHVLYRRRSQA